MARNELPIHAHTRHPLTGEPLQAIWVRPDGRVCWPMIGGAPDDPAPTPPAPPAPAPTPPTPPADPGFPTGTPVEQMTAPQREAYYKNQTQKWQGRAENSYSLLQTLGAKTPEEIAAIKAKVDQHDALERELMSDKDKAVATATDQATATVRAELIPELVKAKFEAAAAGRIAEDRLAQILEPLDLTKFLTPAGLVDTAKVKTYVDGVAPAKGTPAPRSGPTTFGLGRQPTPPSAPGEQGRAMAAKRFGAKPAS